MLKILEKPEFKKLSPPENPEIKEVPKLENQKETPEEPQPESPFEKIISNFNNLQDQINQLVERVNTLQQSIIEKDARYNDLVDSLNSALEESDQYTINHINGLVDIVNEHSTCLKGENK